MTPYFTGLWNQNEQGTLNDTIPLLPTQYLNTHASWSCPDWHSPLQGRLTLASPRSFGIISSHPSPSPSLSFSSPHPPLFLLPLPLSFFLFLPHTHSPSLFLFTLRHLQDHPSCHGSCWLSLFVCFLLCRLPLPHFPECRCLILWRIVLTRLSVHSAADLQLPRCQPSVFRISNPSLLPIPRLQSTRTFLALFLPPSTSNSPDFSTLSLCNLPHAGSRGPRVRVVSLPRQPRQ